MKNYMETVIRCYLRKKGWKGQQKEGKENYWGFPNILTKAKTILDSFLGVLEKCYCEGTQMLTMDLVFFGLLSKLPLDKIISLSGWGHRLRVGKKQGTVKTNLQYLSVAFSFFFHHHNCTFVWTVLEEVNDINRTSFITNKTSDWDYESFCE